jgi:hypothetical protein
MKVCLLNPDNLREKKRPELMTFAETSTERAELEHFARAVAARQALAVAGGDEIHGVTVLESILESARSGKPVKVGTHKAASAGAKKARKPVARAKPKAAPAKRAKAKNKKMN